MDKQEENTTPTVIDPDELAATEQAAETDTGNFTYTHKFRTPFTYMGRTYTELRFDWESLTGQDGLDIEAELQAMGKTVIAPEFSSEYQVRMAAKACTEKIGSDAFGLMSLSACNKIKGKARSFLLTSE